MPILATGIWIAERRIQNSHNNNAGFTLLEVMVVMVLIGIISSFAVLTVNVNNDQQRLSEHAQRLQALLSLHHQEAILLGEQRGLRVSTNGYAFMVLDRRDEWQVLSGNDFANQQQLPDDITLQLVVDGRQIGLKNISQVVTSAQPQIVLLANGEASEFSLSLMDEDERGYVISGDLLGRLAMQPTS